MTSNNKLINVALLVNAVGSDYTASLCRGAAIAAKELDINLLIVPGGEIDKKWDRLNEYEYQNNAVYSYITKNNTDVLIISLGTVATFLNEHQIQEFLSSFKGIKIILLDINVAGYPCMTFNMNGFYESIKHLITQHNKKRIGFVGGPQNLQVAQRRFDTYKKVLRDSGIEFDSDLVVYGDFSYTVETIIDELLDKNKSDPPDAICFANDTMALTGYKVLNKRGLKIGKDIAVSAFDDAHFADVLNPPLTTVKSAIMSMGYKSVEAAVKYHTQSAAESVTVDTYFMCRQSCGCPKAEYTHFSDIRIDKTVSASETADMIRQYISQITSLDVISESQMIRLRSFIMVIIENLVMKDDFDEGQIKIIIQKFLKNNDMMYYNPDAMNELVSVLKKVSLENADAGKKNKIYKVFETFYDMTKDFYAEKLFYAEKENADNQYILSKIANDMMANGSDEKKCFSIIMDDICNMNMKSCYIYVYEQSFLNSKLKQMTGNWIKPGKIYLKAYKNNTKIYFPDYSDQAVDLDCFLNNKYTDDNRAKTMILKSLYFNEEQYGVLLAETSLNGMRNADTAAQQLCTAIKMTRFMNLLESALQDVRQANAILSKESVSDQLTGLYNRRGLILESENVLKQYSGISCRCAVIFADLDSLKVINDTFGHDEGDAAIRRAACILKDNFRSSDIIGRIGGDEFVAFAMDIDDSAVSSIISRINLSEKKFNACSDKKYYVELSVGIYSFDPTQSHTIDELMSKADDVLYENKKNKKRTPLKEPV